MLPESLSVSYNNKGKRFYEIYSNYWITLYNYGWRLMPRQEILEDFIQDIFLELLEKDRVDQIHTCVEAYLKTALRHKILNYFRRQKIEQCYKEKRKEVECNRFESNVIDSIYYQELLKRIDMYIQMLPNDKCKLIFELNWYGMLSSKEIAQQIGVSLKTVEYHLSKALRYLKNNLKEGN